MYRFIRSARIGNAARMPAALQFAAEVTSYLNKHYVLNMKLGVGTLDQAIIQWHFELDSADELVMLNEKLAEDQDYSALVEKYKDNWFAKSLNDTLVTIAR
jgi:hypothetical protein